MVLIRLFLIIVLTRFTVVVSGVCMGPFAATRLIVVLMLARCGACIALLVFGMTFSAILGRFSKVLGVVI